MALPNRLFVPELRSLLTTLSATDPMPSCPHVREFKRVDIAVPDRAAQSSLLSPAQVAAAQASTLGTLLSPTPVEITHNLQFDTIYSFYADCSDSSVQTENIPIDLTAFSDSIDRALWKSQFYGSWNNSSDQCTTDIRTSWTRNTSNLTTSNDSWIRYDIGGWDFGHDFVLSPEAIKAQEAATVRQIIIRQKSEELLLANLSEAQRKTWLAENFVLVRTPIGRTYRVERGTAMNVFLTDASGTRKLRKYCAYAADPGGSLPVADQVFAQLLTLQFNEREFLRHANTWDLLNPAHTFIGQGADADAAPLMIM
jgi:hypothetical protein